MPRPRSGRDSGWQTNPYFANPISSSRLRPQSAQLGTPPQHRVAAEQNRKLAATLATMVGGLDRIESILPAMRELAVRHRDYGVEEEHYGLVGLALVETLREMLGPAFDGETEQAWRDAYRLIATTMIDAALIR